MEVIIVQTFCVCVCVCLLSNYLSLCELQRWCSHTTHSNILTPSHTQKSTVEMVSLVVHHGLPLSPKDLFGHRSHWNTNWTFQSIRIPWPTETEGCLLFNLNLNLNYWSILVGFNTTLLLGAGHLLTSSSVSDSGNPSKFPSFSLCLVPSSSRPPGPTGCGRSRIT